MRRVEALVGTDAFRFLAREPVLVSGLTDPLKARREELPERIAHLVDQAQARPRRSSRRCAPARCSRRPPGSPPGRPTVAGVALVTHRAPDETGGGDLRKLALDVRGRLAADRPAVVAVGAVAKGRPVVVVAVNDAARARGLAAGRLVGGAAAAMGGGGGGGDDVAQAGGSDAGGLDAALANLAEAVARELSGGA